MADKKEATKQEYMKPAGLVRTAALGIEAKELFVAACGVELVGPQTFVTRDEAEEWRHAEGNKLRETLSEDVMTNVVGVTITFENTRARRIARMKFWQKYEYAYIEAGLPTWAAGLMFGLTLSGVINLISFVASMVSLLAN